MEVNLINYMHIIDDVLPKNTLTTWTKIVKDNFKKFEDATIVNGNSPILNKNIRDVKNWYLGAPKTMTEFHWSNFLFHVFQKCLSDYIKTKNIDIKININDMSVLKYGPGGHYKYHTDHCIEIPRTLSFIYLINDDYEGGDLCFQTPDGSEEITIAKKKNSIIMWPSNFLYPHCVKPVTKGTRYSIVAWAV